MSKTNCKRKMIKTDFSLGLLSMVDLKCRRNKIYFAIICGITMALDTYNFFTNITLEFSLMQFYISASLLLIIYLWMYYAPKFVRRIYSLRSAFDNESYYEAYIQYRLNMLFTAKLHNVLKEDKFREFVAHIYGDKEMSDEIFININGRYNTHRCIKCIYVILWIAISAFMVIFTKPYVYDFDAVSIFNYALFIISLILNCYSFYGSITFTYFLRGIIKKGVDKWEYNKYLPSKTAGFSLFVSNIKMNSFVFFMISTLYTLTFYMLISIPVYRGEMAPLTDMILFLQINIIILAGVGMSIALFISGHFFLRRILEKWKDNSKAEINKTWKRAYSSKDGFSDVLDYTNCLEKVDSDRIRYDYTDLPSFILSIVTIFLNVLYVYSELSG